MKYWYPLTSHTSGNASVRCHERRCARSATGVLTGVPAGPSGAGGELAPSSAVVAPPAAGVARTTRSHPSGTMPSRAATRWRSTRLVRVRSTAPPTALDTTKPTRGGSPARVSARWAWTTMRRPPERLPPDHVLPTRSLRTTADGDVPAARHWPSGGQLGATLATTGREDGATGAGPHAQAETMGLGPAAVVGLEGALAHEVLRWVGWSVSSQPPAPRRGGGRDRGRLQAEARPSSRTRSRARRHAPPGSRAPTPGGGQAKQPRQQARTTIRERRGGGRNPPRPGSTPVSDHGATRMAEPITSQDHTPTSPGGGRHAGDTRTAGPGASLRLVPRPPDLLPSRLNVVLRTAVENYVDGDVGTRSISPGYAASHPTARPPRQPSPRCPRDSSGDRAG